MTERLEYDQRTGWQAIGIGGQKHQPVGTGKQPDTGRMGGILETDDLATLGIETGQPGGSQFAAPGLAADWACGHDMAPGRDGSLAAQGTDQRQSEDLPCDEG